MKNSMLQERVGHQEAVIIIASILLAALGNAIVRYLMTSGGY
jgi:hypothetical protein